MIILKGRVCRDGEGAGLKHFSRRMNKYPEVFERATGQKLLPGTLNVNVGEPIKIKEHFRIHGTDLNEPEDFLFEIACHHEIPNVPPGAQVEIALFR